MKYYMMLLCVFGLGLAFSHGVAFGQGSYEDCLANPSAINCNNIGEVDDETNCYTNVYGQLVCTPIDGRDALQLDPESDSGRTIALKIGEIFNRIIIPILFGLALLFFLFNLFRFAIAQNSEEARKKAKSQMLYGIAALVFIVSIWAIVNWLAGSLGLDGAAAPCSDFFTC